MSRLLTIALFFSPAAMASDGLWLEVDIVDPTSSEKVHIEIPWAWADSLELDEADLHSEGFKRLADNLGEGDRQQLVEITEGDQRVVVHLSKRKDKKSKTKASDLYIHVEEHGSADVDIKMPLVIASFMGGSVADTDELDFSEHLDELAEMGPFVMVTVESPDEKVEIGIK